MKKEKRMLSQFQLSQILKQYQRQNTKRKKPQFTDQHVWNNADSVFLKAVSLHVQISLEDHAEARIWVLSATGCHEAPPLQSFIFFRDIYVNKS